MNWGRQLDLPFPSHTLLGFSFTGQTLGILHQLDKFAFAAGRIRTFGLLRDGDNLLITQLVDLGRLTQELAKTGYRRRKALIF